MSTAPSTKYLWDLVETLRAMPRETEWVEFKRNKDDPQDIGEYVSALANGAAIAGQAMGYMVWGVEDGSHEIVGTSFHPFDKKIGNEELTGWLLRLLDPRVGFRFHQLDLEGKRVVVLEIPRAARQPVRFKGEGFIRIGSYKKKLKDVPEKERELWRAFDATPFEEGIAAEHVEDGDVVRLLDYGSYFDLLGRPIPEGRREVLDTFATDRLIKRSAAGGWDVTNLAAMLFARNLADFRSLQRKAIRVVVYGGRDRVLGRSEHEDSTGYAIGFARVIAFIKASLPSNEVVEQALRKSVPMYPEVAIREIVANAVIHQDFAITGAGPMVEIFDDRMEVTNPGEPLVSADRFLDMPPRSRNEWLASLMRRMGICEERGSGIDKVVASTELFQLPAPLFDVVGQATRAVLFAPRPLTEMDKQDRIRACYLHACLKHVSASFMTNSSVRQRFGIEERNAAKASRLIKEAVDAGFVAPDDPGASRRDMRYVPWWAKAGAG